ncbi:MAG: hypothetical protein C0469_15030 [Cyanobacteria bacterium DS2.3.42]|nr:hypothetical protein [Cyanobacteria bacterium DS2.3.42]
MEQYQLLPLVVAVIALLGGLFTGMKLVQIPHAARLKPLAIVLLILFVVTGFVAAKWLTGVLMVIVGSHFAAALLSISLLSFAGGVIVPFCGDAKQSNNDNNRNSADGD